LSGGSAEIAAVCFVKVYGVTFLGRPRSDAAALAVEVGGTMTTPMIVLAVLCVLAGIFPSGAIAAFAPALRQLFPGAVLPFGQSSLLWLVPLDAEQSSYSGLIVLVAVTALMILVSWTVHRFATARLRRVPAWDCGFPDPRPATQYSGASFAQPIRRVFGAALFRARDVVDMPPPGEMRPARLDIVMRDLIWEGLYAPVALLVEAATTRINALQFLTIRRYLTLMFAALVALLSIVALSQ
jgi:NADH:ubiquinone oxidoreductase subunit 5 (subunit L)/multisubunit Na+/H+ antiporter MnhA subunit